MNAAPPLAASSPGRSWRDIRQEVKPVAMSRKGRRRQLAATAKVVTLLLFLVAAAYGVYVVTDTWNTDRTALATAVHSETVREVSVTTDGVLNREWATSVLDLPRDASLMTLDLPALRDRLLAASGQVRMASLTRHFPDILVVSLQERTPVARVQAASADGSPRQLMVAKDGVVYEGLNYDKPMLATLPWLDGVRLIRAGAGFEPIAGLPDVAALLSKAQIETPHLYREWLIVSLARLASADEIIVKTQDKRQIIFGRKLDYFKQLAVLDSVTDRLAKQASAIEVQSVNLTLGSQVPVLLERTPADLAQEIPVAPAPQFSIPTLQRKIKRDL